MSPPPTEWHIVEMLVRNAGKLVTQRQTRYFIAEARMGYRFEPERAPARQR